MDFDSAIAFLAMLKKSAEMAIKRKIRRQVFTNYVVLYVGILAYSVPSHPDSFAINLESVSILQISL